MKSVVHSISWCSIFIARKRWRGLTYNIMPLRKWTNIFNCCLIHPRVHTLRIYGWIFLFIFRWFLNVTIIVSISFCAIFISRKWGWRLTHNIMPLRKWIYILNRCLINPRIHSLRIDCWIFLILWFLHITFIISVSFCAIFISRKWGWRLTHNIMPLRKWIDVFNRCLVNPRIHTLRIDCRIFIVWRFLNITFILSVSICAVFISGKWRWRLTNNIMPLRKSIDIINSCLINPRIHSFRIDSWIFFFIFILQLMKTAWRFSWWILSFCVWWRCIRSWKFIIEHTFFYKMPYFRSHFFMANIEIFFVILEIKSCSFWVWISIFRISGCYCFFWI